VGTLTGSRALALKKTWISAYKKTIMPTYCPFAKETGLFATNKLLVFSRLWTFFKLPPK
jgi:hypothetical protein